WMRVVPGLLSATAEPWRLQHEQRQCQPGCPQYTHTAHDVPLFPVGILVVIGPAAQCQPVRRYDRRVCQDFRSLQAFPAAIQYAWLFILMICISITPANRAMLRQRAA